MDPPVTWLVPLFAAVAVWWSGRRLQYALRRFAKYRASRFVVRVQHPGTRPLALGRPLEPGESARLVSADFVVVDDAEHRVRVADGTRLHVAEFHDPDREATAGDDFVVTPKLPFWLLDAPPWHQCGPDDGTGARALPERAEGYTITTDSPPIPSDYRVNRIIPCLALLITAGMAAGSGSLGERASLAWAGLVAVGGLFTLVSTIRARWVQRAIPRGFLADIEAVDATLGIQDFPIWLAGMSSAKTWLLPPRSQQATPIAIMDFDDPYRDGDDTRRDTVGGAMLLLQDELLLRTDAPVKSLMAVNVGRARILSTGTLIDWDQLANFRERQGHKHWIVRGQAHPNITSDGYLVVLRASDGSEEHRLSGPFYSVVDQLIELLASLGACRLMDRPEGFPCIPDEHRHAYQRLVSDALIANLSAHQNQAVAYIPGLAGRLARAADALATQLPECAQVRLLWATLCVRADEEDELDDEILQRLMDAYNDREDSLYPVSPLLLYYLDLDEEAEAERDAILDEFNGPYRGPDGAYARWLRGLDLESSEE